VVAVDCVVVAEVELLEMSPQAESPTANETQASAQRAGALNPAPRKCG
jgi:hypothetical protein